MKYRRFSGLLPFDAPLLGSFCNALAKGKGRKIGTKRPMGITVVRMKKCYERRKKGWETLATLKVSIVLPSILIMYGTGEEKNTAEAEELFMQYRIRFRVDG